VVEELQFWCEEEEKEGEKMEEGEDLWEEERLLPGERRSEKNFLKLWEIMTRMGCGKRASSPLAGITANLCS
jgi:hypothetical protein